MNVLNKVTIQSLRKNKVRTIVTIMGIILSAAMICAVTTSVSSLHNYAVKIFIYSDGDWHASAEDTDFATYEKIKNDEKIENTVYNQRLGYAWLEGSENEYKPYLYVIGAGEKFDKVMPIHLTVGEYPKSSGEIILPEHLADNGGVIYRLGDTITLELGERMRDGYPLGQNNPYYTYNQDGKEGMYDETIEVREACTYTVVGFYERPSFEPYSAPGYTAITLADKENATGYEVDVYFKMKTPGEVYEYVEDNKLSGSTNTDVLMLSGTARYDSYYTMLYGLGAIVIGLIMFGSVSLIYNAFSISVSERTKQFGLLSSIGATKKQLRQMVFFEAMVVSAIGIPIGVLSGIGGIAVTLFLIRDSFSSISTYDIPMEICVSPISVVIACVVALVTVLISAWIPSKRATKVSAVEAIRLSADVKVRKRELKTPKFVYKLFGLPGMLANKYYKRSRKKYRATVVSLFMSIVLFVSASAFTDYLVEGATGGLDTNGYDIIYFVSSEDLKDISRDELLEAISEDTAVTDVAYVNSVSLLTDMPVENINPEVLSNEEKGETSIKMPVSIRFVDDEHFRKMLKDNNFSEEKYMNPEEPMAVAIDGNIFFDYEQEKYVELNILDKENVEFTVSTRKQFEGYNFDSLYENEEGETILRYVNKENEEDVMEITEEAATVRYNIKSGAIIYDAPMFADNDSSVTLVYPYSVLTYNFEEISRDNYQFYITSSNHSASYKAIKETLVENGLNYTELYDYAVYAESDRNIILIIKVFSYGFIVLISLIAAANVFNTISTNISLRRREFAMLKSVGMTSKGLNKMMNFECLLYGAKALCLGLPVAGGITYLIYLSVSEGYMTDFRLPWDAIGIATFSVFAVVFVTMMYSISKIKKDNPIDALKNENL